jgi:hypothetical protein
MRRVFVGLITGCIIVLTAVLISGSGGLILRHWEFFCGLIGIIMAIIMIAVFGEMRIRFRMEKMFRAALDGLPLSYRSFYGRRYAFGTYRGLRVYFTTGSAGSGDISASLFSGIMIFCTIKIPGTGGLPLYCAVAPEGASISLRSFLGWENPEEGFFIAKALNHSIANQGPSSDGFLLQPEPDCGILPHGPQCRHRSRPCDGYDRQKALP